MNRCYGSSWTSSRAEVRGSWRRSGAGWSDVSLSGNQPFEHTGKCRTSSQHLYVLQAYNDAGWWKGVHPSASR